MYFYLIVSSLSSQKKLQDYVEREESEGKGPKELTKEERRKKADLEERMDIDDSDIIIQGSQMTRLSRKQVREFFF
jgi:hypothetical protein